VGAEAHKLKMIAAEFAIDENLVRFDVAVAMIRPFTAKRMIEFIRRQRPVGGEQVDGFHQSGVKRSAVEA
jgi:hypothetical protein